MANILNFATFYLEKVNDFKNSENNRDTLAINVNSDDKDLGATIVESALNPNLQQNAVKSDDRNYGATFVQSTLDPDLLQNVESNRKARDLQAKNHQESNNRNSLGGGMFDTGNSQMINLESHFPGNNIKAPQNINSIGNNNFAATNSQNINLES